MNKFKNRCKYVYLHADGRINWLTSGVDFTIVLGVITVLFYISWKVFA